MKFLKGILFLIIFYQVSNHGRIRSKPRYRSNGKAWYLYQGKILKGSPNPKGYLVIRTSIDGAKFSLKIHREVAKAFKSNKKNNPEVNHKDGNKIKQRNRPKVRSIFCAGWY